MIRKPRKPKSESKKLENKLDASWSELVKKNSKGKCEYCGKIANLNAHHIIGRANKNTRWLLSNGIALCPEHHSLGSKFSAHQTPTMFNDWLIHKKGRKFIDELHSQALAYHKWTIDDKKTLLLWLQTILKG